MAKTILDMLQERISAAESAGDDVFRHQPGATQRYLQLIQAEMFLKGTKMVLKAPLTMNPEKISNHYSMVRLYMEENGVTLPSYEEFSAELQVSTVNSYDEALSKCVFKHWGAKKAEIATLVPQKNNNKEE